MSPLSEYSKTRHIFSNQRTGFNRSLLPSCIHNYQDRSFVYVLTKDHGDGEYYLYAGKSRAQYARILRHMRKYAFDHAYIFECEPEHLNDSEAATIRELAPMYNNLGTSWQA